MRRLCTILSLWILLAVSATAAERFSFKFKDGSTLSGEIGKFSFTRDGVMVRLPNNQYSRRLPWNTLTQETLRKLLENEDALPFVENLVEVPPEVEEKAQKEARKINIKPLENKLEHPTPPSRFFAIFVSPVGIVLFLLIYGANIYAGYEISIFKNRPAALVCSLAAVFPILAPVTFFCIPAAPVKSLEELEAEAAVLAAQEAEMQPEEVVEEVPPPPEEELAPEPQFPPTVSYSRGQFIFNRRFFETKFSPYFKPVLEEEQKDMMIIIRSARGEFVGHRFSKAEANEIYLQSFKGGASTETMIPYIEITEIVVKHKDAP